jgi:transposase
MNTERVALEAMENEERPARKVLWSGVDVAKEWFDASVWLPNQPLELSAMRRLPVKRFERTPEGVGQFVEWARQRLGGTPRVVMESTGSYSLELAVWLVVEDSTTAPAIINPRQAKDYMKSIEPRNSTDQTAARALARYGVEREPAPYEPPTAERRRLRELTRYRQDVVEMRQAQELRLEELGTGSPVAKMVRANIKQLRGHEERLKKDIIVWIQQTPRFCEDVELLRTIFGVDWIVAATVIAELGDLRRFGRARQMTAFGGVTPGRKESGKSVKGKTRMVKIGSRHLRRVLHLAARCAINGDNDWARLYEKLLAAGKTKMAALGAIMRKMLCVMRAMLISGKPYDPHYQRPVEKPVQNVGIDCGEPVCTR